MMDRTPDTGHRQDGDGARLSARQAAALVGVNERTIRRAIASGDLPAIKRHGVFAIALPDFEAWRDHRASPALDSDEAPRAMPELPRPLTSLVGREREVATALALLRRPGVRLVTLTGPGGVGKTRLALRIAAAMRDEVPDGVWFVPLIGLTEPRQVPGAIGAALGMAEPRTRAWRDALAASLRDTEALLVLDNLEHLIDAAPELVALLQACPRLTLLVTSRFLLRVSGEHALPVPPLEVPQTVEASSLDAAAATPAVRLFAERASAVDPGFALNATTTPIVVDICRLVDGLPLAIELAAARINALPPTVLRDKLDRCLNLPGGARDASPRHRTMRDAIGWSYDLLRADEQAGLRRLSVFARGFSFDAAEHVGGERVTDIIGSLIDKSLLSRDDLSDQEHRVRMLEPVRAFALEQLAEGGELAPASDALADWCLELVESSPMATMVPGGERHLARLDAEHADIRRVLEWLDQHHDGDRLLRLAVALGGYWYERNHYREGRIWTERALAVSACAAASVRARAMTQLGLFLGILGDHARARELVAAGVTLLRRDDDTGALALALIWQGAVEMQDGAYDRAEQALDEVLGLAPTIPDTALAAAISARAMANLGTAAHARGDLERASRWHGMALRTCREHGYLLGSIRSLCDLADVARDRGDFETSLASYRECLSVLGERSDLRVVIAALEGAALAAASWNQGEQAARLLGAAAGLAETFCVPMFVATDREAHERVMRVAREKMDARRFDDLFASGRRLTLAEAIAAVLASAPPTGCERVLPAHRGPLSRREQEVLRLLASGLRDREIAEALFISVRTVEGHMARIFAKLGVSSRVAAMRAAMDLGLVDPHR
jgi:non-specific serine/threonine protein kinase